MSASADEKCTLQEAPFPIDSGRSKTVCIHLLSQGDRLYEMVKNYFDVCGITSYDPNKVRIAFFCQEKALRNLGLVHEEIEDDPFLNDDDELVN